MNDPDECPTCGAWISDHSKTGCEAPWGQRYCQAHLPEVCPTDDPDDIFWLGEAHKWRTI